jgi:hypothetical protein
MWQRILPLFQQVLQRFLAPCHIDAATPVLVKRVWG